MNGPETTRQAVYALAGIYLCEDRTAREAMDEPGIGAADPGTEGRETVERDLEVAEIRPRG